MRVKRLVTAAVPVALAGLLVPLHAIAQTPAPEPRYMIAVADLADTLATAVIEWAHHGYAKSPPVMIGLGALVAMPFLAVLGLLLRASLTPAPLARSDPEEAPAPTRQAWIEIEGQENSRLQIAGTMLRIGRQDDNDLCIQDSSVHRYHAVVYRSADTGYVVMDVGGENGNGIKLNDVPVAQAPLKPGDRLLLGQVPLLFGAADNDRL